MLVTATDTNDQKEPAVQYPTGLKQRHTRHLRSRSSSLGATFYSSAIVPPSFAPLDSEALSSLISSLTLISEAQKAELVDESARRPKTSADEGDLIHQLAINSDFQRAFKQPEHTSIQHEADFCPPPVAGYNTINAINTTVRPKTSGNDRPLKKPKKKKSHLVLKAVRSQGQLKSGSLQSPASNPSYPESRPSYNGSVLSLPLSAHSKVSVRSPFRMFFATKMGSEQNETEHLSPPMPTDTIPEGRPSSEKERDAHRFSAFVRIENIKPDGGDVSPEAKTPASLSPVARVDLNETLIPSRRSSLRSGRARSSRNSRDLKSLNIDQDLIEENHETVQRIRELQQARERRHHEWRKEARRSEKMAAKRMSIPDPDSSPMKKSASARSSWHSRAADISEGNEPLEHSTYVNGNDTTTISTLEEVAEAAPSTPLDRNSGVLGFEMQRQSSVTASTTQSISSAKLHRKRLSDSIKRTSSIKQPMSEDAKGVIDEVESFLGSPRFTQRIRHPRTGRTIVFSEVGDPKGFVVLCCVGMGLTRYVTSFYDEIAKAQKLRIITPDRPGVGETEAMPAERSTPLAWVDDVAVICSSLGIDKFSLLAHSAGAIYALATALKMPQYVRGRIHLLAPWVPPSQLAASGQYGAGKAANLPTSHKILSFFPASFMRVANSRFLSATSASIEPRSHKEWKKETSFDADLMNQEASLSRADISQQNFSMFPTSTPTASNPDYITSQSQNYSCYQAEQMRSPSRSLAGTPNNFVVQPRTSTLSPSPSPSVRTPTGQQRALTPQARTRLFNSTLTSRTWNLSTLDANPSIDLVICLERRRPIGFRYTDITRSVVIHHGAGDTRVPLENVRWLSSAMKKCELRVLEGEGHGLMASAAVMSEVLAEVGREWEEWAILNREREKERRREEEANEVIAKGARRGYPRW